MHISIHIFGRQHMAQKSGQYHGTLHTFTHHLKLIFILVKYEMHVANYFVNIPIWSDKTKYSRRKHARSLFQVSYPNSKISGCCNLLKSLLSGLGLLLLGHPTHHEFIGIEPLVDGSMDAGRLLAAQTIPGLGRYALLKALVCQIVDDGLHHNLLS